METDPMHAGKAPPRRDAAPAPDVQRRAGRRLQRGVVALTAAVAVGIGLLVAGCGGGSSSPPTPSLDAGGSTATAAPKGNLRNFVWNITYGEPPSLDFIKAAYYPGVTIVTNICDQLYATDVRTGKVTPSLATGVERVGDKTLVYTIRSGVKFWDGTTLTPGDVAASLLRSKNDPASGEGAFFRNVASIKPTGPHEVTVKFARPDAIFEKEMQTAVGGTIGQAAYMKAKGSSYGSPTGGVMCTGPYKLERWDPGNQIVLSRNPGYWNKAVVPKADRVIFKFVASSTAIVNGLSSGAFDGAYEVPPAAIPRLKSSSQGKLRFGPSTQEWMIIPISGPLKSPLVRRALSLSLDRNAIVKSVFAGQGLPVTSFGPPPTRGYAKQTFQTEEAKLPGANPDVAGAKQLVAQAGGAAKGNIVLAVQSDSQVQQQLGTVVQDAAKQIGLNVVLRPVSAEQISNAELQPAARKGFDALLFANYFNIPDPMDEVPFFVGSNKPLAYLNLVGYENGFVNAQMDNAAREVDPQKRAELYLAAEAQWIGKDQALIPLVNPYEVSFGSSRVTGYPTVFPYYGYPWAAFVGAP
jgi:peptide/nickel transport system substrate-binding protein